MRSRDEARACFLLAVARTVPAVLVDLKDRVLPEYFPSAPPSRLLAFPGEAPYVYFTDSVGFPYPRWPAPLRMVALAFTRRHHLTDHGFPPLWIIQQLEYTLAFWSTHSEAVEGGRPLRWYGVGEYSDFEEATEKTTRSKRRWEHFDWAARCQTGGEVTANIAQAFDVDVSTVNRAITELLKEIGLTRRKSVRTGRPKRS
jgi:hypothetical protein